MMPDLLDSPENCSLCDATKGDDKCRGAPGEVSMLLQLPDGRVAACHDMLQPLIDLFLRPAQALNILRPLEIANGDTSRVGEDVWDDRDPTFVQDFVGFRIGGARWQLR